MCVMSMVHDYYQPLIPQRWDWHPLVPFTPSPVQPVQPLDPDALRKLLDDYRKATEAAERVDALTGQPDCVDPEKAKLERRVAELEKRLAQLENPRRKKRGASR